MYLQQKPWALIATGLILLTARPGFAADTAPMVSSASAEFGTGDKTRMLRLGIQSDWNARWFQSNGTHLSGYWDLTLAKWRGTAFRDVQGATQSITDIGFTPVFRFQRDDKRAWYGEAGIGVHRLSDLVDNSGNQLSTRFQFGDHIGAGYVFANQWEVGVKIQHFSNGGYKKPNSGVNFIEVKASRHF
jgi:lipid A 3-O-deacylase